MNQTTHRRTKRLTTAALLLLTAAILFGIAACGHEDTGNVLIAKHGSIGIDDQKTVHIYADDQLPATIDADRTLRIDGHPVPLNAGEKADVDAYYTSIAHIQETGATVGHEGFGIAKGVFSSLLHGDFDSIGDKVNNRVDVMMKHLQPLCDAMAGTYDAQTRLVSELQQFAPYAIIDKKHVTDCRHEIAEHQSKMQDNQTGKNLSDHG